MGYGPRLRAARDRLDLTPMGSGDLSDEGVAMPFGRVKETLGKAFHELKAISGRHGDVHCGRTRGHLLPSA